MNSNAMRLGFFGGIAVTGFIAGAMSCLLLLGFPAEASDGPDVDSEELFEILMYRAGLSPVIWKGDIAPVGHATFVKRDSDRFYYKGIQIQEGLNFVTSTQDISDQWKEDWSEIVIIDKNTIFLYNKKGMLIGRR